MVTTNRPHNPVFLAQLRENGPHVPADDVDLLQKKYRGVNLDFLEALISEGHLSRDRACRLWGESIQKAYVDPLVTVVTPEAVDAIPVEIARKAEAIGLYKLNNTLTVAVANPSDEALVRRLSNIIQCPVSPVFALPCEINDAINLHYTDSESIGEDISRFERAEAELMENLTEERLRQLSGSQALSSLLDSMILLAIREKASDIHMEPQTEDTRVRFRVDGNLHVRFTYSKAAQKAFTARVKVMCKLNIAETRVPQDGRFSMPIGTSKADFRVSVIPTILGEKVVIRLLAGSARKSLLTLDKMMMSPKILQPFRRLIANPNGIIFVTGPTGSGKTTTLYGALHEMNDASRNISTIEDPIEIQMDGLTQSQVSNQIDLSFARLLRSILRQDPDVILVGEIRDLETAKIAIEAALTGHLVLSTLHTNNAVQAIVRLVEIGIEPYMVAPSVIGVMAQRLAARICEKCKETYYPGIEVLERYFTEIPQDAEVPLYRGIGCDTCRRSGYSGRIAFHELVVVSEEMRGLIAANASSAEITAAARKIGYRPLRYDGLKKMLMGLTTPEEVDRHSVVEWNM